MAPMRYGKAAAPSRKGPVALATVAGVAAGLLVASWVFAGSRQGAALDGVNGGSGSGSGTAVPITTASTGAVASLQAEVKKLLAERDAARQEAAALRAQAGGGGGAAGAAGAAGTCPDRHTPWGPSAERDKQYPELAEFLKKVGGCTRMAGAGRLHCGAPHVHRKWCCLVLLLAMRCHEAVTCPATILHTRFSELLELLLLSRWPSTMRCWWRCPTKTTPGRAACSACGRRMRSSRVGAAGL